MASNAKFEIEIYGNTAQFENSLKGINTAMSGLKGEASALKRELKLDPTNTNKMAQLQRNLQQQLQITTQKSAQLKKEISEVDKTTPDGQKKFLKLSKDLQDSTIKAGYLEKDIAEVEAAINRGNWKADLDTAPAEKKVSKLKGLLSSLKEIGIGALRSIGEKGVSMVTGQFSGWINDTKATQKAMNALRNTMDFAGVGKDFDSLSRRMGQVAKDTNANTEDALKLGATFIGLGDNAQVAGDKVENIIKANQAFGGTGEQLKGVVQAYSQMSAAGKVSAENINQLTDNNTALGAALKKTVMDMNPQLKQFGSFAAASEKGAITVDMLDGALKKLGQAGGGSVETIDDAMASLNETISLALLPILEAITPVVTDIVNAIADKVPSIIGYVSDLYAWFQFLFEAISDSGALDMLSGAWGGLVDIFKMVMQVIGELLMDLGILQKAPKSSEDAIDSLADVFLQISGTIEAFVLKIRDAVKWVTQSEARMTALKVILVALAGAFGALKVANGIFSAITAFAKLQKVIRETMGAFKLLGALIAGNWVTIAIVAIGALVAGLVYFFTKTETGKKMWASFIKFLQDTLASIVSFFQNTWKTVTEVSSNVVKAIQGFFSGLGTWFSNLWKSITDIAKTVWGALVAVFEFYVNSYKTVFNVLVGFFTGLWSSIVEITSTVWETIKQVFITFVSWINTTFAPLINFFRSLWNLVASIVNLAWQVIIGIIRMVYNNIISLWTGIINFFRGVWNTVSSLASSGWNAIVSFASSTWNKVVGIWNQISSWFSGIWNSAKNIASGAWNAIVSFASSAWNRVVGIWNAIVGWFSGIWNNVANTVGNAFNRVASFAASGYSRIVGVFSSIAGWFSGVFNSVANVVSGVFNQFYGFAANAFNNIVNVFNGIVGFFANIFNSVANIVESVLGGITRTIDSISSAVNGVAGKVKGFFGGSIVAEMRTLNLGSAGMIQHSANNQTSTVSNVFHITAGQMDITSLARSIKREIEMGRA
ncbi:tape measure protein [Lactococcus petauri]|uniref:phage tail protein n=1 Tax=Lactococcus petauri TaxID=1940789 RepID=UPI0018AC64F6|nr:tape measure protein [Lactococcus petauri]